MAGQGQSASGLNTASRPSYRVVMLGDQGVGKSSISHRFIKDDFQEHNAPTVGGELINSVYKKNITLRMQCPENNKEVPREHMVLSVGAVC